jgi:hypothetical protein
MDKLKISMKIMEILEEKIQKTFDEEYYNKTLKALFLSVEEEKGFWENRKHYFFKKYKLKHLMHNAMKNPNLTSFQKFFIPAMYVVHLCFKGGEIEKEKSIFTCLDLMYDWFYFEELYDTRLDLLNNQMICTSSILLKDFYDLFYPEEFIKVIYFFNTKTRFRIIKKI